MNNIVKILLTLGIISLIITGYLIKLYKNISYSVKLKGYDYQLGQNLVNLQLQIDFLNNNMIGITAKDFKINFFTKQNQKIAETERTTIKIPSNDKTTFDFNVKITKPSVGLQKMSKVFVNEKPITIKYQTQTDVFGFNINFPKASYKLKKEDIE